MKKFKKLSRRNLEQINGAGTLSDSACSKCPSPNDTYTCDEYWALSAVCRNCVLINTECYVPTPVDL